MNIVSKLVAEGEQRLVAAWTAYAAARGLTLLPRSTPWDGKLQLRGLFSGIEVVVDLHFAGEASVVPPARVSAHALQPLPLKSQVRREDGLSGLTELLGTEDHQVGSPAFDAMFVVKADNRSLVSTLYGEELQRALFALPEQCSADYEHGVITVRSARAAEPAVLDAMIAVAAAFARAGSPAAAAVVAGPSAAYRGALPIVKAAQPMPAPGLGEHGFWGLLILFFGVGYAGLAGEADKRIQDATLGGPLGLVLGAEGAGLRRLTRERCDVLVKVPMTGSVESLNVSVTAGICLYEAMRQRTLPAKKKT